jgi:hypothetical protein
MPGQGTEKLENDEKKPKIKSRRKRKEGKTDEKEENKTKNRKKSRRFYVSSIVLPVSF